MNKRAAQKSAKSIHILWSTKAGLCRVMSRDDNMTSAITLWQAVAGCEVKNKGFCVAVSGGAQIKRWARNHGNSESQKKKMRKLKKGRVPRNSAVVEPTRIRKTIGR